MAMCVLWAEWRKWRKLACPDSGKVGGWDWQGIAGINKELDPLILSQAAADSCRIVSFSPFADHRDLHHCHES